MKPYSPLATGLAILATLATRPAGAASSGPSLTNAADVISLTAKEAKHGRSVSVTGVVTVAETTPNWKGKFFVQDATGGVFVNNTNTFQPMVGDLVLRNLNRSRIAGPERNRTRLGQQANRRQSRDHRIHRERPFEKYPRQTASRRSHRSCERVGPARHYSALTAILLLYGPITIRSGNK